MKMRRLGLMLFATAAAIVSGCNPVGRGVVAEPLAESQLMKTKHPTANAFWSTALGPASAGEFRSLAVADFNHDGLPDVAAGGGVERRGVRMWLNNGDGTWSSVDAPKYYGMPSAMAAADVNKDGKMDLVVAGKGEAPGIRVYLGNDKMVWKELPPVTNTGRYVSIQLVDVNEDQLPDIVATREAAVDAGGVSVFLNADGKGWSRDVGPVAAETYNSFAIADFNRDGHLDIAATRWGSPGGIDLWYGNGRGSWSRAAQDPAVRMNFQGVCAADFNGDGWPDIAATSYRGNPSVMIFLNTHNGGWWSTPVALAGQGSFWDVQSKDLNGDGLPDLVASSFDGRGIRTWLQLPRDKHQFVPTFLEQSYQMTHTGTYYWISLSDFNTDQRPDICSVSVEQGVKVWFQTDKQGMLKPSALAHIPGPEELQDMEGMKDTAEDPFENLVYMTLKRNDGAAFTEYRMGPADELNIEIYPGRQAAPILITKAVDSSGELLIPVVSPTPLRVVDKDGKGLTPSQLRDIITAKLKEDTFKDPAVSVVVNKYNARKASILGEVRMKANQALTGPGWYTLGGKTRVLSFIAEHGGFTEKADLSRVEIRNRNGERRVVDLFKAIFQSKLSQDIVLDDGDVITIPSTAMSDRKVYVLGEVAKPGVYGLQDNVSLIEAVQLASSFLPSANRNQIIVIRGDKDNPQFFEIDMMDMLKKGDLSKNIALQDGDIVFVPRNWVSNLREFYSWFLPGWYAYRSGNTSVSAP